jgi:hypothetical protein
LAAARSGWTLNRNGTPFASARATDAALRSLFDTGSAKKKEEYLLLTQPTDDLSLLLFE